jgi:hypothetical protein
MPSSSEQTTGGGSEKLPSTAQLTCKRIFKIILKELNFILRNDPAPFQQPDIENAPAGQQQAYSPWSRVHLRGEHGLLHHVQRKGFWRRLRGKTRDDVPGVIESIKAIIFSSCAIILSLLLLNES